MLKGGGRNKDAKTIYLTSPIYLLGINDAPMFSMFTDSNSVTQQPLPNILVIQ